jgi:broad specificity phosphatase PhoE
VLILVRHAMPAFGPDVPAHAWELGEDGRREALALCASLRAEAPQAMLAASAEPKAWQTLAPAGEARRDPRFNEVSRVEPWEGEFRRLRREYVDGTDHLEWEPRATVAHRFDTAVAEHLDAADGRPLIIATHGMAMTVWLTARIGLPDPGAFWADLRFPDAHRVDLGRGTVVRWSSKGGDECETPAPDNPREPHR